ncbi:MAG: GNAT family N-acetyltransferase [Oscillospiraceae bacterium]|nr:GNAT family N-acetyltransferase [Oscillospiraceae bacterium]
MENLTIRTATMADLEQIAAVEAACFPAAEAATKEEFADRLAHYADHFWLMFEGDALISFVDGFVTDEPDLADEMYANAELHKESGAWQMIFGVNTIPSRRCRGLAGQLLRRAISDARAQGRRGLVLTCKEEKLHYYAKFGFRDEGVSGSTHGGVVWHQMRLTFKKALVLFPCDAPTRQRLLDAAGDTCEFTFKDPSWTVEDYRSALKSANIIIGEPKNDDLPYCEALELMQSPSSGVNYYVQGGKFPPKAALCCATGAYGPVIAEHMLAMTLALCRRLPEYRDQQHRHQWELRKFDKQLEGSTVLILGAGDIGTTLARWLRPMVGRIIGLRRTRRGYPDCFDRMITPEELDEALPEADIVLCALPHTPETVGLLNVERLGKLKPDAVLVNGGRGSLIDQEALCALLDVGRFWGVGLEVTTPEPLPADHPLWDQPRVIITPHAAGNSFAPGSPLERRIWDLMIRNISGFLRGDPPENRVDFSLGYRPK